ncbi:MAG: serine/threonine protein phosphatase [Cryomorphaceae bacterium]|nr:serine/threonine protein phosphatase [Cryomorphaceae bacterium]
MKVLVVGDVHGCYYTFKKLLRKHWNPEDTILVQLGDMINKGPHSVRCLKKGIKLKRKYPHLVYFLLGNHEYILHQNLKRFGEPKGMGQLRKDANKHNLSNTAIMIWIEGLLPFWETPHIHISHAGISRKVTRPLDLPHELSIINNRKALRNIGKTQVVGHVVYEDGALFNTKENAWHIDSGAFMGNGLSALLIDYDGQNPQLIVEPTSKKDLK